MDPDILARVEHALALQKRVTRESKIVERSLAQLRDDIIEQAQEVTSNGSQREGREGHVA